jgi:hypothetical protein
MRTLTLRTNLATESETTVNKIPVAIQIFCSYMNLQQGLAIIDARETSEYVVCYWSVKNCDDAAPVNTDQEAMENPAPIISRFH